MFIADVHIKLGNKKIPDAWAVNRMLDLADSLTAAAFKHDCYKLMIGGDLLDVANPKVAEVGLLFDFLDQLSTFREILLYPGNHEMVNKKADCYVPLTRMLGMLNTSVVRTDYRSDEFDVVPFNILHNKEWLPAKSKICFTHVRGAIPPHVEPEIDLTRFACWDKVFAGDLHSYKNSQGNLYYPGSPVSTSFHRNEPKDTNGYFIIDTDTTEFSWHELELPHLIRKTVTNEEDMIPTTYHHTIYEVEGDMETLATIKNSELLDKKVNKNVSTEATLIMSGKMSEEVAEYLVEVEGLQPDTASRVVGKFVELVPDDIA